MKAMDRSLRSDVNRETRSMAGPVWKQEIQSRVRTPMDTRVLAKGAALRAGNPPVLVAATSNRKLRGGLVPGNDWKWFEFGANRNKTKTYSRRSKNGGKHQVTRHTARQLPAHQKGGRVVFPAVADIAPRIASLWVQTVVRKVYEAFGETS